jgi:hypothetical protein
MREIIDFASSPFIDLYRSLRTSGLLQKAIETIDLRQYIPVSGFARLPGVWRALDPRNHLGEWEGMDNIGRMILLGCEIGIGLMIVFDLMVYLATLADYSTPATTALQEDTTADPVFENSFIKTIEVSTSQAETSSEFKSTSTDRTNTTTITTDENDFEHHRTISQYLPERVLQQYICPRYSTWPPYYLQAFHKTQESVEKEDNGHADAPPSSGTRNNKDGCVGKIVLEKKVVKRDLKNGVVTLHKGVQMVSLMTLAEVVADQ